MVHEREFSLTIDAVQATVPAILVNFGLLRSVAQVIPSWDSQISDTRIEVRELALVAVETNYSVQSHPVGELAVIVGYHQVVVNLTATGGLLSNATSLAHEVLTIGCASKEGLKVRLA